MEKLDFLMDPQKTPGKRTHSHSSVNGYSPNSNLESFSASRFENSHSSIEKLTSLEAELQEVKEKYALDMKNMQDYINLLRKKLKSVDPDQVQKEKEKSLTLYKALKAKEKECTENHTSGHSANWQTKVQLLILDKNNLEKTLLEAEKDMKRLYQEIKHQNEIISGYKDKTNTDQIAALQQKYSQTIEDLKVEREKSLLLEHKLEKSESIIKDQNGKIAFLLESLKVHESFHFTSFPARKTTEKSLQSALAALTSNEKQLEAAKSYCKELIIKSADEANQKLSQMALKLEELKNDEKKLQHFLKILQERINENISKVSKTQKELGNTKAKLFHSQQVNRELQELNAKNMKKEEESELRITRLEKKNK